MASLKISVGDTIPKGSFGTVPFTEDLADQVRHIVPNPNTMLLLIPCHCDSRRVAFVRPFPANARRISLIRTITSHRALY
jgi:hypothetical protein